MFQLDIYEKIKRGQRDKILEPRTKNHLLGWMQFTLQIK